LIVTNSEAGRTHHVTSGYASARFMTIHNGIDTDRFRAIEGARAQARASWNVADGEFVVGASARLDPIKDHPTALRAVARLARRFPDVKFVCCGGGADTYRRAMEALAHELGIGNRVIWAGEEERMEHAYAGFDILCSSSIGEGFSNSIAEAMACGIPCVVTDVGDSAEIVGDAGAVVPAGDPDRLADALAALHALTPAERAELGVRARARIVTNYQLATMVARTSVLYRQLTS
jgi:glycosyltransferase involved in cell wall biosynthesis